MAARPAAAMSVRRAVGAGSGDRGRGTVIWVPDPAMVSVVPTPSFEGWRLRAECARRTPWCLIGAVGSDQVPGGAGVSRSGVPGGSARWAW